MRWLGLAVLAARLAVLAPSSQAQMPPILDEPITTTTAPAEPPTTPTSAPSGDRTCRKAPTRRPPGHRTPGATARRPRPGGSCVPPEAQRIINSVQRTRPNNDSHLLAELTQLEALGLSQAEAYRIGLGRFPIAGPARYSHDWLYPRYGPGFRFHLGTDVFAAYGTPVRAPGRRRRPQRQRRPRAASR